MRWASSDDAARLSGQGSRSRARAGAGSARRPGDEKGLLALLDGDLAGPVIVLGAPHDQVEQHALQLVHQHALRAMDAWHLAVAAIVVPALLEPGEPRAFASRDEAQRQVAEEWVRPDLIGSNPEKRRPNPPAPLNRALANLTFGHQIAVGMSRAMSLCKCARPLSRVANCPLRLRAS